MKLEELYPALQKRYPIEQEKKAVAEKKFKEDLKKEILTIIHYAKKAIEDDFEKAYQAYEEIVDKLLQEGIKQEDLMNDNASISFKIRDNCIDYTIHIRHENVPIGRLVSELNICDNLENLLSTLYCFTNKGKTVVRFDSYLVFDLTKNTIKLDFTAKPSAAGGFSEEEQVIIKRFISDLKELFPYSEKFPEFAKTYDGLELILKSEYFESEYDVLVDLPCKQKILNTHISEFNFSTRALNTLIKHNINTIGDLVQLSEKQVRDIKNIGYYTVDEIKQKLQRIGLSLLP